MLSNIQKSHILINEQGIDFYTVKGLNDVHQEMLKLLSIIDDIAESNNIKYWIDGGSLIGTVRHNGFIPWDDDFDISLLKEDYLKLITALDARKIRMYIYFIVHLKDIILVIFLLAQESTLEQRVLQC
mgnify:CR=1 FL=1